MRVLLSIALLTMAPLAGRADDTARAVERAKACSARASERQLTDKEQKEYLKACIASEGPLPDPGISQREVRRRCDAEANARSLTGDTRSAFIQACRR